MNRPVIDWKKIFSEDEKIIQDATVYSEKLPNDFRRFGKRFFGLNKEMVLTRAQEAVKTLDRYSSPHMTYPCKRDKYWSVDVYWYSLD